MFTRKIKVQERSMPTAEAFASWGAYELSFEELLEVNGGKRERKANSGGSSGRGSSGSSGSSGGSSGCSRSSRSARTSSSSKSSSKSKEKKNKNSKTQSGTLAFDEKKGKPGTQSGTSSGNNLRSAERRDKEEKQNGSTDYTVQKGDTLSGIIRKQYPGASKEEIVRRVKEAAANSGITDIDKIEPGQKIIFEKPAQSSSGQPNAREKNSPTQGGSTRRGSRPPSNSGSSGSFTSTSSGESSGCSYSGGGRSGYHPPAQSQPVPKPNKGEETSPTQGGGAPRGGDTPSEQKQPKITQGAEKQDGEKLKNFFNSENNVGIKPDMNFPIDMSKVTNIGEYGPREKIEIGDEETKPFHGGMDFAAPADTDIFSATDGWVRENGNNNIYGNYVIISDDKGWSGTLTYYAHMNETSDFTVGTQVEKGQKIGSVGSTGLSTGPHLHFEVRTNYGQTKHDPRDFLPFSTQTGSFE